MPLATTFALLQTAREGCVIGTSFWRLAALARFCQSSTWGQQKYQCATPPDGRPFMNNTSPLHIALIILR